MKKEKFIDLLEQAKDEDTGFGISWKNHGSVFNEKKDELCQYGTVRHFLLIDDYEIKGERDFLYSKKDNSIVYDESYMGDDKIEIYKNKEKLFEKKSYDGFWDDESVDYIEALKEYQPNFLDFEGSAVILTIPKIVFISQEGASLPLHTPFHIPDVINLFDKLEDTASFSSNVTFKIVNGMGFPLFENEFFHPLSEKTHIFDTIESQTDKDITFLKDAATYPGEEYTLSKRYIDSNNIINVPFIELEGILHNIQKRDTLQFISNPESTSIIRKEPYKFNIYNTTEDNWTETFKKENSVGNVIGMFNCVSCDLSETKIPEGTKTLEKAFINCINLTHIPVIPQSVENISDMFGWGNEAAKIDNFIDNFKNISKSNVPIFTIVKELTNKMYRTDKDLVDAVFEKMGVKNKKDLEKVLIGWKEEKNIEKTVSKWKENIKEIKEKDESNRLSRPRRNRDVRSR